VLSEPINSPETSSGEINGDFPQADFWPGTIHGLPVTRAQCRWTSAIGC